MTLQITGSRPKTRKPEPRSNIWQGRAIARILSLTLTPYLCPGSCNLKHLGYRHD